MTETGAWTPVAAASAGGVAVDAARGCWPARTAHLLRAERADPGLRPRCLDTRFRSQTGNSVPCGAAAGFLAGVPAGTGAGTLGALLVVWPPLTHDPSCRMRHRIGKRRCAWRTSCTPSPTRPSERRAQPSPRTRRPRSGSGRSAADDDPGSALVVTTRRWCWRRISTRPTRVVTNSPPPSSATSVSDATARPPAPPRGPISRE